MQAAANGRKELIESLLDYRPNLRAKSSLGETAAMLACQGGFNEIYQMLTGKRRPDDLKDVSPRDDSSPEQTRRRLRGNPMPGRFIIGGPDNGWRPNGNTTWPFPWPMI